MVTHGEWNMWMNTVGRPRIQNFTISVTGMYRRDAMLRQVSEAVVLGNAKVGIIINTKRVELCLTAEICYRQWRV